MNRLRVVLVAAALLVAACKSSRQDPREHIGPTHPVVTATATPTELKVNWDLGVPIVEVFIDGHGPWNFVLDSGAGGYALDQRVADELKLERVELSADGTGVPASDVMGGRVELHPTACIHEIRCGPLVERDTNADVFDLSAFEQASGTRVDGLLPAAAFWSVLLTLDYAGRTVTVGSGELPPADGADVLSMERMERQAYIALPIAAVPCRVLVDTGSNTGLCVPASREPSLRFRSPPAIAGLRATLAGVAPNRMARLDGAIAWGRHRIADPVVVLSGGECAMAGSQVLREFRITFDFSHSRIRFERGSAEPIRSKSVRGLGGSAMHKDGVSTVDFVLPGGPAERAGVRVGDRIESVDGESYSDISSRKWEEMMQTKTQVRLRIVRDDGPHDVAVDVATFVE